VAIRKLCILRKNYEYLVNELRVSTYLDAFFSERVMSFEDKENLQKERGKVEQARKFLGLLLHTAEENIKKFFEILKTRQDKQPHIYRHLLEFSCADDQTARDDVLGQPIARRDSETVSSSLRTNNTEWEELVIPHFPALLAELKPSLLLHHLRAAHLLTSAEYDQLLEKSMTEEDRSQKLLNTILPSKEGAVAIFCQVLQAVDGQQHIVPNVLKLNGYVETTQQRVEKATSSLPGNAWSNSEAQVLGDEIASQSSSRQQESQTVSTQGQGNVSYSSPKRPTITDNVASHSSADQTSAIFVFRPGHLNWIKNVKQLICSMCYECFGIAQQNVVLAATETPEIKELIKQWSNHPVYLDSNSVLAVLLLEGVERENIHHSHHQQLEKFIWRHLSTYDADLKTNDCKVLQVLPSNSSSVILELSANLFAYLLCSLGERSMLWALKEALQVIFPEATTAVLRLGGLPPLQLFSDQANEQSYEQKASIFEIDEDSPRTALETYKSNQNMTATSAMLKNAVDTLKEQVMGCFKEIRSLDETLKSNKKQAIIVTQLNIVSGSSEIWVCYV
jgi:hypothetical protein